MLRATGPERNPTCAPTLARFQQLDFEIKKVNIPKAAEGTNSFRVAYRYAASIPINEALCSLKTVYTEPESKIPIASVDSSPWNNLT